MAVQAKNVRTAISSTLILSLLTLAGCKIPGEDPPQTAAAPAAPQPAPYTPPTADQLAQMVAPIALFPDKLVGQVLAGATYPEQIVAADQWLAQHPTLKGDALQNAEASQPWDVSVKSLTAFPSVLDQMAGNIQWTRSLGDAYVNDPNDVMNAIQTMRLRAQQAGTLKNSPQLRVSTAVRPAAPANDVAPPPADTVVYSGPAVVPPPPQTIIIEPAEPDVVYVPHYNPAVVYGAPVPVYPGWTYRQPVYTSETVVSTGLLSFGVGVLVGAAVSHHDWGWHAWGVNWGEPVHAYDGGWHRPAVTYNNSTYVSKSATVVNRINNINVTNNNYRTTNNFINRTQNLTVNNAPRPPAGSAPLASPVPNFAPRAAPLAAQPQQSKPNGPMSMPHFTARDAKPGPRPQPAAPAMHASVTPPPAPPAHQEARIERTPLQARMNSAPAAPVPEHVHAEHERPAPEHNIAMAPVPPAQHAEARPPRIPAPMPPVRETHSPDHLQAQQPHPVHQEMLAMHNEHPHAPAPASAKPRVEKHEEHAQQHAKNDKRDNNEHHS